MTWSSRRGWSIEDSIQSAIVDAIAKAAPDVLVFAIPNGGAMTQVSRGKLFGGMGARAGVFDLELMWRTAIGPRVVFAEVKLPIPLLKNGLPSLDRKYQLRPEQQEFACLLDQLGIPWRIWRSTDDALDALRSWGAPLRIAHERRSAA